MRRGLMGWNARRAAGRGARGAAGAAARRDGRGRHGRVHRLHQQCAARRGDLDHRLHALLVGRAAAGAADRRAGVCDGAVEARVGVDQDHRSGERDRQHAEARREDRRAAEGRSADPPRRRAGIRHAARGPRPRPRNRGARGRMDRRHGDVRGPAPRRSTTPSAGCWHAATPSRLRRCARRKAARRKTPARLRASSSRTRGLPARKKPISRSRPISMPTRGSTARRSRRRWRSASRCARRLPTRAAGSPHPHLCEGRRGGEGRCLVRCASRDRSTPDKPLAAQLADKVKELPGASLQCVDGRKLHRQLSAVRRRVVAHGRKRRASERPVPGADRRADAQRRAVDRRSAADRRSARLVASESLRRHSGARRRREPGMTAESLNVLAVAQRNVAHGRRREQCPRSSSAGRSGRARGCIAAARPVTAGSSRCRRDTSPRR